jgi:hypothetical protein
MRLTLGVAMAALIVGGVAPQLLERSATAVVKQIAAAGRR